MAMRIRAWWGRCAREQAAQATVEMAIVLPVLLVLALLAYNVMLFVSAVARFDRIAPDIVIAEAVSPSGDEDAPDTSAVIEASLTRAMGDYDVEIEVSCSHGGNEASGSLLSMVGGLDVYTCTLRMAPWPGALTIAGVSLRAPSVLSHARTVTIDPWRSGVVA